MSEQIIMEILRKLKDEQKIILIVHHDLSKVERYFDQLLIFNKRLIASGKTKQVFQKHNLLAAYGAHIFISEEQENDY
ncbi:putative manganese ABC transporter ATP-binding protein [Listeria floridensis FSL S10-1187]|uniref:Manganese ABC transporter ATP-binding protein n=1 Tax=Listeria floridensis FSL S10-1187 TaxID=1265817 RepID=A0ABP3AU34_9LIST|nr:hypothetical protein [Listeria floridensis]EUJ25720.1 putative manganese ABC transporter ATP-binding protein [Listeria floridensis FSL S10-1187]